MMCKIVALNELKTDEKPVKEDVYSQEFQEALAESEYNRALRCKANGNCEVAFSLFSELLETKVLSEIAEGEKGKKMRLIRFNCFKQRAYHFEEVKGEEMTALDNYIEALNIDDSDVYLSQRCAQLAFKVKQYDLAEHCYENCLKYNKNHFIAADGLLRTLCKTNNVFGAFYLAAQYYKENPRNRMALAVLQDVKYRFPPLYKSIMECYKPFGDEELKLPPFKFDMNSESVFNLNPTPPPEEEEEKPDLKRFQIKSFSWQTIGKYIVDLYKYLKRNKMMIFFIIPYDEFYLEPSAEEDVDAPGNNSKPKKKKRISDIELLQQWHWWPKYKTNKFVCLDPPRDGSFYLKYFLQGECKVCKAAKKAAKDFDLQTKSKLDHYKTQLKNEPFDLVRLMELWLENISSFWAMPIPSELITIYLEVFRIYQPMFNLPSLSPFVHSAEIRTAFDMHLFFLELEMDKIVGNEKPSNEWVEIFYMAQLQIALLGIRLGDDLMTYQLRLLNMEYLYSMHANLLTESATSIVAFEEILEEQSVNFVLHLPNGHCIDRVELVGIFKEIDTELTEQEKKQAAEEGRPYPPKSPSPIKLMEI